MLIPYQAVSNIAAHRVLVFAPHPDDEVFGCGGAIMRHIAQQVPVHVIIVTDGAYGVSPDETTEYARQRRNESIAAAAILDYGTPEFWQQPDRGLYYGEKLIGEISAAIRDTEADLIYAPSVYEIHPDHRALAMATLEAVRRCENPVQLAFYEVGQPFQPNLLLDISDLAARKMEAMRCFASQNAKQRYDLDIAALNRYRTYTLPAEVSAAEAYILTSTETLASDPLKLYQSEHARQQAKGLPTDTRDLPLVSVIIRSMDRDTLSDALDSVALQTYPNIEVVLVNAKGQEHSAVGEWCGRFPLRMTTNDAPLSRSKAANAGLDAAQGKYLIFLDDDDFFLPTHIAGLKAELEKTESLIAVYSAVQCINQSGTEIRRFNEPFDSILFRTENFIPIHAVLFRRSNVENGVRFDETLTLCEDWDFWLQMLEYGQFRLLPETTAIYRMELSQSGVWENAALSQQMMTIIYRKWLLRWPDNILWRIMEYARCKNIINQRDKQIHAMHLTIHERDLTIHERDITLQQNSEAIYERDITIQQNNEAIYERDITIQQNNETIYERDITIQQNNETIRTLYETIQARDTLITTMDQQITCLLTSTSWKVTKPLRALKHFTDKIMR